MRRVREALEKAVTEGIFPGAVLWVGFRGEIGFVGAYGCRQLYPHRERMTLDTIFDVASLTKPLATTTAVLLLTQRGIVSLEDTAAAYVPRWLGSEKEEITLRHLLSHSAGLPSWRPYYQALEALGLLGKKEAAWDRVFAWSTFEKLLFRPGTSSLYSDIGFLLLGAIVERASGRSLDVFCREEIFHPLNLETIGFLPIRFGRQSSKPEADLLRSGFSGGIAATEDCPWRKRVLCGEVDDENAYALGGVAGHAGLFSTAKDIYRLAKALFSAYQGEEGLFHPLSVRSFFSQQRDIPGSTWALGWDTPSSESSSSGRYFSARSVGHLGYTGTSLWIDLERSLLVILLTNRVHPSRNHVKIKAFRPWIHDLIIEELGC